MEFRVLGPVEVVEGSRSLPLGGTKQRALLAILVLNANRVVSTDRLIEALWGETAPEGAAHTVQVYMSQLRKALRIDSGRPPDEYIVTEGRGYVLRVDDQRIDLQRARNRIEQGRKALAEGVPERASRLLREALELWRGAPLASLEFEAFASPHIARIEDLRLSAIEDRIEADLALGRHAQVIGELQAVVGEFPLRERLAGQLMRALYRSGRQAEALQTYRNTKRMLGEELGIDPTPDLQQLERAILQQDPELAPAADSTARHLAGAPPRASDARHEVQRPIDEALARALAKTPHERYSTSEEFASAPAGAVPGATAIPGRRPRSLALAVAAAAIVGLVTVSLLGHGSGGTVGSAMAPANTLLEIDPATNEVVGDPIHVADGPLYLTASGDSVWVASPGSNTLDRVDARTHTVMDSISLGATPTGLTSGEFGTVWVAEGLAGQIVQVDPAQNSIHTTVELDGCCPGPMAIADAGNGAVWVASTGGLRRVDPAMTTQRAPIPHSGSAAIVSDASGDAWVADGWDRVSRFAQGTSVVRLASVPVGGGPEGLAFAAGDMWVTASLGDTVNRIDASTDKVIATIPVGRGAGPIAATEDAVWVANPAAGTIMRIDPTTNELVRTIDIGHRVTDVAVGNGRLWVAVGPESAAVDAPGTLVFDDGGHIYTINADGTDQVQLTDAEDFQDSDPDWSPDGQQIVFARSHAGHPYQWAQLYVINADGSGLRRLTSGIFVDLNPDWSPDGTKIVFVCGGPDTGVADLCVIDSDGSDMTDLTPNIKGAQGRPAWSPDGEQIVFRCQDSLCTVDAEGRQVSQIVQITDGATDAPQWAPDGIRLSFGAKRRGIAESIYLTNRLGQGSDAIAVATSASTQTLGATTWEPDGYRIAFGGHFDFRGDVFVMYADGSGITRLTNDGRAGAPDWRPYL